MALTVLGALAGEFQLISSPKWIPGKLVELDALELVYQGSYNKLNTFRNTLSKWKPSALDGNMFLESFPSDGDRVKPTVTLRYVGCINGVLPASQLEHGKSLTTANFSRGDDSLEILYESPHTVVNWIGTSAAINRADFSNPEPDIVVRLLRINGVTPTDTGGSYDAWVNHLVTYYFNTVERVTDTEAREIVPNKYWMCSATTAKTLEPK